MTQPYRNGPRGQGGGGGGQPRPAGGAPAQQPERVELLRAIAKQNEAEEYKFEVAVLTRVSRNLQALGRRVLLMVNGTARNEQSASAETDPATGRIWLRTIVDVRQQHDGDPLELQVVLTNTTIGSNIVSLNLQTGEPAAEPAVEMPPAKKVMASASAGKKARHHVLVYLLDNDEQPTTGEVVALYSPECCSASRCTTYQIPEVGADLEFALIDGESLAITFECPGATPASVTLQGPDKVPPVTPSKPATKVKLVETGTTYNPDTGACAVLVTPRAYDEDGKGVSCTLQLTTAEPIEMYRLEGGVETWVSTGQQFTLLVSAMPTTSYRLINYHTTAVEVDCDVVGLNAELDNKELPAAKSMTPSGRLGWLEAALYSTAIGIGFILFGWIFVKAIIWMAGVVLALSLGSVIVANFRSRRREDEEPGGDDHEDEEGRFNERLSRRSVLSRTFNWLLPVLCIIVGAIILGWVLTQISDWMAGVVLALMLVSVVVVSFRSRRRREDEELDDDYREEEEERIERPDRQFRRNKTIDWSKLVPSDNLVWGSWMLVTLLVSALAITNPGPSQDEVAKAYSSPQTIAVLEQMEQKQKRFYDRVLRNEVTETKEKETKEEKVAPVKETERRGNWVTLPLVVYLWFWAFALFIPTIGDELRDYAHRSIDKITGGFDGEVKVVGPGATLLTSLLRPLSAKNKPTGERMAEAATSTMETVIKEVGIGDLLRHMAANIFTDHILKGRLFKHLVPGGVR